MYAHVNTYRLGSEAETSEDIRASLEGGGPISDQSARTVASWWHSPAPACRNITSLSHGLPFDTEELAEEVTREITDPREQTALLTWIDALEVTLS